MSSSIGIVVLSDGKPGHLNQSLGLAEALSRLQAVEIETIQIERRQVKPSKPGIKPDLILGAGHSVHLPMLLLARRSKATSVVLMKPSLPRSLFDYCVIPEHDLKGPTSNPSIIPTQGALNRVPPPNTGPREGGLILLGGPSTHHGWNYEQIESNLQRIVKSGTEDEWAITDSRRTPPGALEQLATRFPSLKAHPHSETGPNWLPERLNQSSQTWVTEDSVSMIYEALSSGTRVGLLPMPRTHEKHRVIRGVDQLIEDKLACAFSNWNPDHKLPEPSRLLREADRAARILLDHHASSQLADT